MSSQDKGWRRHGYPPRSGEPAAPDILEQGSDRPPARWRLAVRWRRPPAIAIVLGTAGLLGGLVAGYAAGTLHAESATATAPQSGATASPARISPAVLGGATGQFQLLCPAGAAGMHLQPVTPATNASPPPAAPGSAIMMIPSGKGLIKLTCRR